MAIYESTVISEHELENLEYDVMVVKRTWPNGSTEVALEFHDNEDVYKNSLRAEITHDPTNAKTPFTFSAINDTNDDNGGHVQTVAEAVREVNEWLDIEVTDEMIESFTQAVAEG